MSTSIEFDNYIYKVYKTTYKNKIVLVDSLALQCIKTIANNWIHMPLLKELKKNRDIYILLNFLPTDLPLELAVKKLFDDKYWKKAYIARWKNIIISPKPKETIVDYEKIIKEEEKGSKTVDITEEVTENDSETNADNEEVEINPEIIKSSNDENNANLVVKIVNEDISLASENLSSWKQLYVEHNFREILENLLPENYNPEEMKKLCDICEPYMRNLNLKKLQTPLLREKFDRIPLHSILSGLTLLKEISICFKQSNIGDNFTWRVLKTTINDIRNFAKGLECLKHLVTLRVQNSDINCEKVIILLQELGKLKKLELLDFSHCKISDIGVKEIANFLPEVNLRTLILSNNFIGEQGAKALSKFLTKPDCLLSHLDLRLNAIGNLGANYLAASLINGNTSLKQLLIAGCSLDENCSLLPKLIRLNGSLTCLNINNNYIGETMGKLILDNLAGNRSLSTLDVRMCKLSPETENGIGVCLSENRRQIKKIENENIPNNRIDRKYNNKNKDKDLEEVLTEYKEYFQLEIE